MDAADIIALAQLAAQLLAVIQKNVEAGKDVFNAGDLAAVKAILDPLHQQNLELSERLDAALAEAETK